jgi:hypothetical protein
VKYKTDETDPHQKEEEMQWAGILSAGDPAAGMILVFIQKLCTAFHELRPAYEAGALNEEHTGFLKNRMLARIDKVISVIRSNAPASLSGLSELADIRERTAASQSLQELADLTGEVHRINHMLCTSLEARE